MHTLNHTHTQIDTAVFVCLHIKYPKWQQRKFGNSLGKSTQTEKLTVCRAQKPLGALAKNKSLQIYL